MRNCGIEFGYRKESVKSLSALRSLRGYACQTSVYHRGDRINIGTGALSPRSGILFIRGIPGIKPCLVLCSLRSYGRSRISSELYLAVSVDKDGVRADTSVHYPLSVHLFEHVHHGIEQQLALFPCEGTVLELQELLERDAVKQLYHGVSRVVVLEAFAHLYHGLADYAFKIVICLVKSLKRRPVMLLRSRLRNNGATFIRPGTAVLRQILLQMYRL